MNHIRQSEQRGFRFAAPVMVAAVVAAAFWVSAGDLDPPPGTIQPTNRVQLNQQTVTWPYTISQSGSYVLTSDLNGASGQNGILIEADDVTLDLNGFAVVGGAESLNGISATGPYENIVITNGTVRDWGQYGVHVGNAVGGQVSKMRAYGNGIGIAVGPSWVVSESTAESNDSAGLTGVSNQSATFIGCTARANAGVGILSFQGSLVLDSRALDNGWHGISVTGSTVSNCTARGNDGYGISAGVDTTIVGCTVISNGGDGINGGIGCTITDCTAGYNADDGIAMTPGATGNTITGCNAYRNTGDGIEVGAASRVMGNNCHLNGVDAADGAGIHVTGRRNRIDTNNVTDNDRGIDVDGTDNIIIRNSAGNNTTDYDIGADNAYGPIVLVGQVGDITAVPNANHPWANFSLLCPVTWCLDADGDLYGDPAVTTLSCTQPSGYVSDCTDCDDANAVKNPGEDEVCDGLDNDCDGTPDDGNPGGGGWCDTGLPGVCRDGTLECVAGSLVCDQDTTSSLESCDGLDNDCDGQTDERVCPNGTACTDPGTCQSNYCVDGYCCNSSCNGVLVCRVCDWPGNEGTCTMVPFGSDPDEECTFPPNGDFCDGGGGCCNISGTGCSAGWQCCSGNCNTFLGICL